MNSKDLNAYLNKVGLSMPFEHDAVSLQRLHNAQIKRIPFENFNIALGKPVDVDSDAIVQQLVYRERGGYCYQLNGLMLQVLNTLGFNARPLLARVHLYDVPTARSHQVTLVELDGQMWLVDTGFGSNTPRAPLPLQLEHEIKTDLQTFRFIEAGDYGYLLQIKNTQPDAEKAWLDLYSVDLQPVFINDIAQANFYSSHSPDSFFCTARVAALPTEHGIITLLDQTLKVTTSGKVEEFTLEENDHYLHALKQHFGLALDATFDAFVLPIAQA